MIESEKPMNQEGLEEEISKKYANDTTTMRTREQYAELARHFAKWGAEHLADACKTSPKDLEEAAVEYMQGEIDSGHDCLEVETNEPLYYPEAMKYAFIAGAKWQKEQMLKDAVECKVFNYGLPQYPGIFTTLPDGEYNEGDKVRIIIVKED